MNLQVVVAQIIQETPSVKRFVLIPPDGQGLPPFAAGAHITTYLHTEGGVLERHYSLVSDPEDRTQYQIAVRLHPDSRGGSAFWHTRVRPGDTLTISYPKNHFPLSFRARHHVLYAAGIGITPFLSMMADLSRKHASFELHMAARSREECPFYDFLVENYTAQCRFYFSEEGHRLSPVGMANHPIGTHVYICGPDAMVQQFRTAALGYGYPPSSIHWELFTPPVLSEPKPFRVKLEKSGMVIDVPESDTLLEALLKAGVKVPYSCRVGRCGTCRLQVLAGQVEHHDQLLSEAEQNEHKIIVSCVSRARSPELTLSL
jgi:ferredoxin-NADP reductase